MTKQPTYFDLNKLCPRYPGKCEKCLHKKWCWKYNHGDDTGTAKDAKS